MNEFYNLRVCTPYSRLLQSSTLKHLMTNTLLQAWQKALGSRIIYTGLTKQMILSRTKTTRKHLLVVISVPSRNKREKNHQQQQKKKQGNRSAEFYGKDTKRVSFLSSDNPTMTNAPCSTKGRNLGTRQCTY